MKKFTTFACMTAIAFASTVGFSSCKSDKNDPEGNFTGEVVKTEFSISLPDQAVKGGPNRMPSTTVQDQGIDEFQGITSILLVPFAKAGAITTSDNRLGKNIHLGEDVAKAEIKDRSSKAKVYSDVSIPLTTSSFLFYGRSAAAGTKFQVGSLLVDTLNSHNTPAGFKFDLEQIVTNKSALMAASGVGGKLMTYLTHVAIASDGTKRWYAYTAVDDAGLKAMFDTLVTMHGLSSFEVERVLTDLNKSLKPLTSPLAVAIRDSINNATYATIVNDSVKLIAALKNFPESVNLPSGSIDLKWNSTSHVFEEGLYSNMADPEKYVYPAQLWYFVNSTIKTSNSSQKTAYENNSNDWAAILALHTAPTYVNPNTRAVAIKDAIQYGVARLDVDVKLHSSSLADNSEAVLGVPTAVDCSDGFPVTAVFVGGQKQVGFDFKPNGAGTEYTIYDNAMASGTMKAESGAYSAKNHTLVLENTSGTDVMIAVEMQNTLGVDFYGVGGQLIPKGGKFYVIAKLVATEATQTSSTVFKQDYTTTARLNLKSLKQAYNTLPDLRTPQLELGFAVDLTWQAGHTYAIDID